MATLFITGTDTNVGKTIVTRTLLQLMEHHNIIAVPYKPVACGNDDDQLIDPSKEYNNYTCEDNSDVLTLQASCSKLISYHEITSYSFTSFSMPVFSALDETNYIKIDKINDDLKRLETAYKNVIIEGTHGWLTPINKEYNFADWVKSKDIPTILVVGIKEGCINHAQITVESIRQKGVNLVGWIANRVNPGLRYYPKMIELLNQKIDAPLLGEIPYIGRPERHSLFEYIKNPEPLLELFKNN